GREDSSRVVCLVGAGLSLQLLVWLFTTHLQSRFLMPLIVPMGVLCGLAGGSVGARAPTGSGGGTPVEPRAPTLASAPALSGAGLLALAPMLQLVCTLGVFLGQRPTKPGDIGRPNQFLIAGPGLRTGQLVREMPQREANSFLQDPTPELFLNLASSRQVKVCLLGDATPLYFVRPVMYNTTYDAWPISGDPSGWSAQLRERGVGRVL